MEVEYLNTGGKEILGSDVIKPLTLTFPEGVEVIEPEVTTVRPAGTGFEPQIELVDRAIVFAPTLMNQGDSFSFKVLTTLPSKQKPTLSGRIIGISRLTYYQPPGTAALISDILQLFLCALLLMGWAARDPAEAAAAAYRKAHPYTNGETWVLIGIIVACVMTGIKTAYDISQMRKKWTI